LTQKLLGSGRSGKVFLVEDNHKFCVARKILFEDKIANLIHYFLFGAPTIGNLAYPCQLIYSAAGNQKKVAQFIVYDFFTRLGAKVPGWGGEDTLTEHFFNHCADVINRRVN
jgi:hypothetical protein